MRRSVVIVVAVVICIASVGGVAFAQTGGSDRRGDTGRDREAFRFFGHLAAETVVPAVGGPPPAPSAWAPAVGDVGIRRDDLFALDPHTNGPTGEPVGTVDMDCTYVRIDLDAFELDLLCSGVVTLPRGMITLQTRLGLSSDSGLDQVFAITGGSGSYDDAGGHLVIHELSHAGDEAIYEFQLLHLTRHGRRP
jgi:hypothetical protein